MKKALLLIFLVFSAIAYGQEDAWVYFNQKPDAETFLSNPLSMLSQRALDRRSVQNIPLDEKDVPISQNFVETIENATGISVKAKSKWLNAVHVRGSVSDISALAGLPFVSQVVFADKSLNPTNAGKINTQYKSSSTKKNLDTQVNYNYGNSQNQIQMLNGHLLHQQNYTGAGKIIAVLDSGFPNVDTTEPFASLFANNQILGGYNFVSRNDDIYSLNNHGTLVLSTMGGHVDNQLVGTAPGASYYLFVTEDASSENPVEESLWVEAAEMADSLGVDVINTSLGYFTYDDVDYSYVYEDMNGTTSFIARGADVAFSRGMIVVVSAGNSGNGNNPNIATPADAFNVLTVGAVNAAESYAIFSSIGPTSDGRVKPDVMAQGQASVVANTLGNVVTANGTSFSSPIMAGMVACLWQALPDKSNQQIIQLVKESAHLYSTPNTQFGYGIPDFYEALLAGLGATDFMNEKFTIFPNPAKDYFSIEIPIDIKSGEILVYNSLGQLITKSNFKIGEKISTRNLSKGIYLYRITSAQQSQTGKLIIN